MLWQDLCFGEQELEGTPRNWSHVMIIWVLSGLTYFSGFHLVGAVQFLKLSKILTEVFAPLSRLIHTVLLKHDKCCVSPECDLNGAYPPEENSSLPNSVMTKLLLPKSTLSYILSVPVWDCVQTQVIGNLTKQWLELHRDFVLRYQNVQNWAVQGSYGGSMMPWRTQPPSAPPSYHVAFILFVLTVVLVVRWLLVTIPSMF